MADRAVGQEEVDIAAVAVVVRMAAVAAEVTSINTNNEDL